MDESHDGGDRHKKENPMLDRITDVPEDVMASLPDHCEHCTSAVDCWGCPCPHPAHWSETVDEITGGRLVVARAQARAEGYAAALADVRDGKVTEI